MAEQKVEELREEESKEEEPKEAEPREAEPEISGTGDENVLTEVRSVTEERNRKFLL